MNKQEALEALLAACRAQEGRAQDDLWARLIRTSREAASGPEGRQNEALVALGGVVLALLVDEVEPVVGRDLDDWLCGEGFGKVDEGSWVNGPYRGRRT